MGLRTDAILTRSRTPTLRTTVVDVYIVSLERT